VYLAGISPPGGNALLVSVSVMSPSPATAETAKTIAISAANMGARWADRRAGLVVILSVTCERPPVHIALLLQL
jgi:hypothetical protein